MALRRRPSLPAEVRGRLDLARGDRLLAAAELTDGWAVATTAALHVLRTDRSPARRPWSDVDGARLTPESAELTVTWVDGAVPTVLHLADDRATTLPRTVHERVQASVVHTEKVILPSGSTVRVAVRRTADGGLVSQVLGTEEVDLTEPGTAEAVDAAEARVREAVGLR